MKLHIVDILDGSTTSTDLSGLSKNLKPGILCRVEDDGSLTHLGLITTWDLVHFARIWAGWVNPEPTQEVSLCFKLVDRWLEVEGSVSPEELEAARSAWAAGRVAALAAARAAAEAAAWAAGDRGAAVEAARAAAWAAGAAGAAGATARAAAGTTRVAAWDAARPTARAAAQAAARAAAEAPMYQRQGELILETLASR